MLESVDPRNTADRDITMRAVLDKAERRIGDRFGAEPLVEAAIRRAIGTTYLGLGQADALPVVESEMHSQVSVCDNGLPIPRGSLIVPLRALTVARSSRRIERRCRGVPGPKKSDAHPRVDSMELVIDSWWLQQSGAQRSAKETFVTDSRSPETLSGCRAEARRLLKHLRGGDPERVRAAAARFVRLRSFAAGGIDGVLAARARVQLKHALAVVAEEQGSASWLELEHAFETRARAGAHLPGFHTARHNSLLNRWFTNHAEAHASLKEEGGYLLPFRDQFFVTESEGILALGLDPDDPDWAAIGFDLVRPLDLAAHARLCARRRAAIADGVGVPTERERVS